MRYYSLSLKQRGLKLHFFGRNLVPTVLFYSLYTIIDTSGLPHEWNGIIAVPHNTTPIKRILFWGNRIKKNWEYKRARTHRNTVCKKSHQKCKFLIDFCFWEFDSSFKKPGFAKKKKSEIMWQYFTLF